MPLLAEVTVIQPALLTACHAQRDSAVKVMLPVPPDEPTVLDVGEMKYVQLP
jgi:hypothetical protein